MQQLIGQDLFTLALERLEIRNAVTSVSSDCSAAIDAAVAESLAQAKAYIREELANVTSFNTKLVSVLPSIEDAESSTIYFVPKNAADPNNFDHWEYIKIGDRWELIGNTEFNIQDYLTKTEASNTYVTKQQVQEYINTAAYHLIPATEDTIGGVMVDTESIALSDEGKISILSIDESEVNDLF